MIYADLAAEDSARELAREALRRFGKVDIFIHNAGTATGSLEHHLSLHLKGAVWAMSELWPAMVKQGFGRVLITVSGVGMYGWGAGGTREGDDSATGFGENWLYGVAKAGAYGLTRHLANRGEIRQHQGQRDRPDRLHRGSAARHDGPDRGPPAGSRGSARSAPRSERRRSPPTSCTRTARLPARSGGPRAAGSRASSSPRPRAIEELDLTLEEVRDNVARIRDEKDYTVPASSGVG